MSSLTWLIFPGIRKVANCREIIYLPFPDPKTTSLLRALILGTFGSPPLYSTIVPDLLTLIKARAIIRDVALHHLRIAKKREVKILVE